ncbi:MAG TPA: hypothetical protein VF800_05560 [Telluria sp.]|jgi:hypothetical protein
MSNYVYQGNYSPLSNANGAGLAPQGIDLHSIIGTVAQHAAQILPDLLMGLLSSHPQLSQIVRPAGAAGISPQSFSFSTPLFQLGVSGSQPQVPVGAGVAGFAPQGIDLRSILGVVASGAAQALPVLLTSLLKAHPQAPQLAAQGIDFGTIAHGIASVLVPQIPGVLNHFLGGRGSV